MRKLMALCLAMLMALSMCSFTAMAAEVDFAEIANGQPVNFVTADLDLGSHTITSSDEAVIETDGTVTRPLFEDAVVQVAIDGGEAVDVTVKAQTVSVLYAEDFAVDNDAVSESANKHTFEDYSEWYIGSANNNVKIADGKLTANHTDGDGRVWLYHKVAAPETDEPVTIQFDSADIADVGVGIDIRFGGSLYDADGDIIGSINNGGTISRLSASGWGGYWMGSYKKAGVTMKYDPTTGDFWGNGVLYSKNLIADNATIKEGYTSEDVAKVAVTSLTFVDASDSATGTYTIDNFAVYQDVPAEDVLVSATPAQQSLYYSKYLAADYIANGGNFEALTKDLKFEADEELVAGVSIEWESSDEAVIATDGTVTRPFFEPKTVTITGTVKVDGADDIVKTYTVKVLPLSMTSATEVVDAENLEAGSFVGAEGWTPAIIKEWEAMEVKEEADGNKYFSISTSAYEPTGSTPRYTFKTNPAVGEGETLVFEAKVKVPVKGGVGNWTFYLNNSEIAEFIYYSNYLYDNDYDLGNDAYYGAGTARNDKNITADTWYNIRLEITENAAATTGWTVNCFIDGKNVGTHSTKNAVPEEITSAQFGFTGRSNMDSITEPTAPVYYFDTDDIQVYTTQSVDSVLDGLDDAGKVAFFKELVDTTEILDVTAGQTLGLDATYADYDLDALGVTITWKSSDESYISNDGKVNKLAEIGTNVTVDMTATITAGAESGASTIEIALADGTVLVKSVDFSDTTVASGTADYVTDDAAHGSVLHLKNETTGHNTSRTIAAISGGGRGDRLVVEADVKYVHGEAEAAYGALGVMTYAGKKGIQVGLNYNTGNVSLVTTTVRVDGSASILTVDTNKSVTFPMPASVIEKGEGEWVHITVDHNALSQTYSVYLDGQLVNEVPLLQAQMDLGANGGSAIRGFSIELSQTGEMWVDNVSLKKFSNTDAVEVNAALNAALVEYASDAYKSVLTNCDLPSMTIGKSWINGSAYKRDLDGTGEGETPSIKVENPSTYTYVEDGPALTYEVNGDAVDSIDVAQAGILEFTVTATANGITESKTVARKAAPVAIRGLALGTESCLNGVWLEGATGNEKVVVVTYLDNRKVDWVQLFDLAELTNKEINEDNKKSYNPETGILKGIGVPHPGTVEDNPDTEEIEPDITEVKIFVMGENGICPATFRDGLLDW